MPPNMPMPMMNDCAEPMANTLRLNSRNGSSASSPIRLSMTMKLAMPIAPRT